jgi:8-oxo-dGTP pyrophosphatase MutT (NUDIX family)
VEEIERDVVRIVVLDSRGHVLLFHTKDPTAPHLGQWWELPGGGLDEGETYVEAAVRELAEETGFRVTPGEVGRPVWRRRATFLYRRRRYLNNEVVVAVRLPQEAPPVDGAGRVGFEDEDYFAYRWWSPAELAASDELFYPGRLPELFGPFLAGEGIDEELETWS